MSDFLGNLVARGRGADNVVKPRLPGLFEPVAPGISVRASSAEFAGQPMEAVADADFGTSGPITQRSREEQSQGRISTPRDSLPTSRKDHQPAFRSPGEAWYGEHGESRLGEQDDAMLQQWAELDESLRAFRAKLAVSHEPQPLQPELTTGLSRAARPDGDKQRPMRSPEPAATEAAKQSGVAPIVEPQKSTVVPVSPPRALFSREKSNATKSRGRDQRRNDREIEVQPAEPVIHVTIGRVEVRAIQQEGASRTGERTKSSVMSLEEYLQKRSTGAAR